MRQLEQNQECILWTLHKGQQVTLCVITRVSPTLHPGTLTSPLLLLEAHEAHEAQAQAQALCLGFLFSIHAASSCAYRIMWRRQEREEYSTEFGEAILR